jgi:uncharacterized protein YbjT (DUF2867 family)
VAAACLTQPGHAGKIYELTGPELLTFDDMTQIIGRVIGRPLKYVSIPPLVARLFMLRTGTSRVMVSAVMELAASLRRNEGAILTGDVQRVTGRPPRAFETWCREHVAAFQAAPV